MKLIYIKALQSRSLGSITGKLLNMSTSDAYRMYWAVRCAREWKFLLLPGKFLLCEIIQLRLDWHCHAHYLYSASLQ
jgi:hypothetical protein